MKQITPLFAARMGLIWVLFPAMGFLFLFLGGAAYSIENLEYDWGINEALVMVIAFLIGSVLAMLWTFLTGLRWYVWAFSKVSDPVDLHAYSIAWKLMDESSESFWAKVFTRYAFAPRKMKVRWEELKGRLQESDNFLEEEKLIYYSTFKLIWWPIFLGLFGLGGIYLILTRYDDLYSLGLGLFCVIGTLVVFFVPLGINDHLTFPQRLKLAREREVQLQINREGIAVKRGHEGFIPWQNVSYVTILKEKDNAIGVQLGVSQGDEWKNIEIKGENFEGSVSYLSYLIQKGQEHFGH